MTLQEFEKLTNEVSKVDNPSNDYGITCEAMFKIDDEPEKYISYLLYIRTRSYYQNPDNNKFFSNKDALPCNEVHDWVEEIIERLEFKE